MNVKKIYIKFIFITDTLAFFILSYAMLTEWYNRGMSSLSSTSWLLLGLLFFSIGVTIGVRKILKKPSVGELLKQLRTRYKS